MIKNWFILFIFLTGIIYSLSGIAKPQQKKDQPKIECWYTELPSVVQIENCGTPICEAKMNCNIHGILYSDLFTRCPAIPGTITESPLGHATYSCPSVTGCSELIKLIKFPKLNRGRPKILVTLSNNYILHKGKVFQEKKKPLSEILPGGIFTAHPHPLKGGSIIGGPTPPPTESEEPEDAGSTQ